MTTASTTLLGLALPVTGELSGTWGDVVNASLTNLLDTAIAGTTTLSSDADVTLTTTTLSSNQARQAIILWTAGGTVTRTITAPAQSKPYIVINKTSSSQSIKIVGVGPTTGVTIAAGTAALVAWNGVDFVTVSVTSTTGILPVANGGTGLASGTSGGVLAYTATGTLASSGLLAANALVLGGGAGAAPATTTTGTGVVTALGVNTGSAGAFVVNGGALGSPSSAGTIPAFTLGGTIAGGGNQINNVVIGTTTPLAGAFTTLSANGTAATNTTALTLQGTTTGFNRGRIFNTGGDLRFGIDSSVGAEAVTGSAAYSSFIGSFTNTPFYLVSNSAIVGAVSSTGLAVTGTLTSTLDATHYGVTVGRGGGAVSTNTAVGASALNAAATGTSNTGLGYNALYSISSGSSNTGVGRAVLGSNTTGSSNTAVGQDALGNNSTASNNTAVGYQAGYANQTGSRSVLVGATAGYAATALDGDTHIGFSAGSAQTTGFANTFVGSRGNAANNEGAGKNVTTGTYNTFIGGSAGGVVTTGSKNTILGNYAGNSGGLDIRTASNYVVLSDGDGNIVASSKTAQTFALQGGTLSAGTGIAFPATQSASTDANTLDDYEEGTWTPTLTSSSGTITTPGTCTGTYTKIGRFVIVRCTTSITTLGTAAGDLRISGSPFFPAVSVAGSGQCIFNGIGLSVGLGSTYITVAKYDGTTILTSASAGNNMVTVTFEI